MNSSEPSEPVADVEPARAAAIHPDHGYVPPGHPYSPIPDWRQVEADAARIFGTVPKSIPGIDLNGDRQLALLRQLGAYYATQPFGPSKSRDLRYYFDNPMYSYCDALFLHCMLRHLRPRHLIEIGSGFSTCVTLDTNERFLANGIEVTSIDPHPEALGAMLRPGDGERFTFIPARLQDVELAVFDSLEAGDILFVDSSHVSKIDSDVNRIFFEVLPRLRPGVTIHFHDVFYPFEYPKGWIDEGRAWNEIYMLRAFLQFNGRFSIELMSTYLATFHAEELARRMPLCMNNPGGSLWLRKA